MSIVILPFLWFIACGLAVWTLYYKFFKARKPGQAATFTGPEMAFLVILLIYIGVNIGMAVEMIIILSMV